MRKLIAEVRFELDLDDEELKLYQEEGLSAIFDQKGLMASEFDEITYEDVGENEILNHK